MAQLLIVTGLLAAVAPVVGIPTGRPAAGTDHTDTRRILRRADVPAKYTKPTQPPILWNYTVEAIWEEAYRYTNETKAVTDKIVASVTPANATFDNVLLPLELFNNRVSTWINGGFLAYVSADPALREAAADTDDYFSAFFAAHNARNDVFALVKAVWEKQGPNATIPNDLPKLDKEAAKILELTYKGSVGAGLGIPAGPARDDYLATRTRISELQNRFAERLRNIQGGVWFDPSELDGVPQSAKDRFAKGEPGTPNEGKLFMSFTDQDVSSVTNYAFNPQTRRKAYVAYENRAADNSPILKETVVLRDKAARALGYPSHAAYRQEERMAKNPANVNKFLSGLREHLADRAAQQLQHLLDVKKADMASRNVSSQFDGSFYLWDWAYHNRLVVENEYNINRFEVSQYFSALPTIATMLDIFSDLMGFVFVELTEADLAALSPTGKAKDVRWHEDVIAFSVWEDEAGGSGFVGYLLLDLYPRPGKRGGGATFTLSPAFLANEDVPANAATAALVMNLNPPSAPGEPGLLLFGDVVTMFHELGKTKLLRA